LPDRPKAYMYAFRGMSMPEDTGCTKVNLTIHRAAAIDTSKSIRRSSGTLCKTIGRLINLLRLACRWLDDLRGMGIFEFQIQFYHKYCTPGSRRNQNSKLWWRANNRKAFSVRSKTRWAWRTKYSNCGV